MIHKKPMHVVSLYTESESAYDGLLATLDDIAQHMGWIWSAGEDQEGFWCELFTMKECAIIRGESLVHVLKQMLERIEEYLSA